MIKAPDTCTEPQILEDLKQSDKARVDRGMTCLYYKFEAKVRAMVRFKGGDEDIAQESLVKTLFIFANAVMQDRYNHEDKMEAFFMKIATLRCIDGLRGRGNDDLPISGFGKDDPEKEQDIPDPDTDDPLEKLIKKESDGDRYERYDTCLKKLSPKCQERIYRYYVMRQRDNVAYKEFGDASPDVCKVRRNECKKQLKACYDKH